MQFDNVFIIVISTYRPIFRAGFIRKIDNFHCLAKEQLLHIHIYHIILIKSRPEKHEIHIADFDYMSKLDLFKTRVFGKVKRFVPN